MRMIGTIPADGAADAERFSDYLVTQRIENMVEESAGGDWAIWVEKDDHLDQAKAELAAYLRSPGDAKYDAAGARAEAIRNEKEKEQERRRTRYVDVRSRWGTASGWAAPVTIALMAFAVAVSIGTQFNIMDSRTDALRIASAAHEDRGDAEEQQSKRPQRRVFRTRDPGGGEDVLVDPGLGQVARGQVWRLVTPIFLHFSILGLIFNVLFLRDLGAMFETNRGSLKMVGLVLAAAVIPNLVEYLLIGPFFGGLGGIIYALLAYVWIKDRYEPHLGLGVSQQTLLILIGWLLLGLVLDGSGSVRNIAALAVGAAIAYAPIAWRRAMRERRA